MNSKLITIAFISAFILAGCTSKVKYIDPKDSKEYTGIGLDYHDIEDAASKSVQSLLQSGYVKNLGTQKSPKVLAISDVTNDTMQNFSTEELTRKITRDMRNSGKFILTMAMSGSGGTTDKMLKQARDARDNSEFNQYTVQEKGNLIAPELSLSGKIVQRNTKIGSKQRVDYYFLLTLTDIKTGLVVWDDEVNIIKLGSNKSVAW
ncbi:penicillin-binding protein activator LpoB [Helicobacter sp. 12S02232-10]|uniref:penicillin-binding protein activator LpoB n=1 Tax=Helicobacter sp. 12S02232-10 TaxID=1476197 RepID=UPI000BA552D4|nr:penicillin-binding protein activator LpoB [Helicobacter sp. 12S02232-10]PAF48261.1 penicillin-binding protein activator LpoB [Helicobacter sp. 12S02232-10]